LQDCGAPPVPVEALDMDYEGQKMDFDVQKMDLISVVGR
jgi:hypothetical protein